MKHSLLKLTTLSGLFALMFGMNTAIALDDAEIIELFAEDDPGILLQGPSYPPVIMSEDEFLVDTYGEDDPGILLQGPSYPPVIMSEDEFLVETFAEDDPNILLQGGSADNRVVLRK